MSEPTPLAADELLRALVEAKVDFVVIGGLAYGYHVEPRATKDVDIVPKPDRGNLERLVETLGTLAAQAERPAAEGSRGIVSVEALAGGGSHIFQTRLGYLHVLQSVAGLDYADLAAEAEEATLEEMTLRICSFRHLVIMKEAAGRARDREDLEQLRKARGEDV